MELWAVLVLLGGIVALDTTAGPQVMVSEPLVSCTLVGILTGMPEVGVLAGMLFQLLWLGYLPLGAVRFVDHGIGGFIGGASLLAAARIFGLDGVQIRAAVLPSMVFGMIAGIIGLWLSDFIRSWNAGLSDNLVDRIERGGETGIAVAHFRGMGRIFLKGVGMTLLLVPVGAFLCGLVRFVSLDVEAVLAAGSLIILGAVSAVSVGFYWLNGERHYLLFGSMGGFLWFLLAFVQGN